MRSETSEPMAIEGRQLVKGSDHSAKGSDTEHLRAERWPTALHPGEGPRVTAIIPTFNEADNLPHVLPRLPDGIAEVIVVDGHSSDRTVEVARELCPRARIVMQDRRGKGNAIACGLRAATGDAIVMLDADGSADPAEIPLFIEALESGAEYVKGSRYLRDGGSADLSRLRSAGNRALGALVNILFGTSYTDLCYGYNAFWKRVTPMVYRSCDGFEVETILNLRAARAGLSIAEVPSFEHERIHGTSNLNAFTDGWRVLRTIVRERLGRPPKVPTPALRRVVVSSEGRAVLAERRKRPRRRPEVVTL